MYGSRFIHLLFILLSFGDSSCFFRLQEKAAMLDEIINNVQSLQHQVQGNMAPDGDWDAQKMLDLYIHDYMLRKGLSTTADIFAQEANVEARPVVEDGPDGFLREWWQSFWGMYSSRMAEHPEAPEGFSVEGNSGFDNMVLGQPEASLFASPLHEGEYSGLPAGELNSNQFVGVDNPIQLNPSSGHVSNSQLQTHMGDQQWAARGNNYGVDMGEPSHVGSSVNGAPEAMLPIAGPTDAGTGTSANLLPVEGWTSTGTGQIPAGVEYPVLNSFVPAPNQESQFQTQIPDHQRDVLSQAIEKANGKQISSFQGSSDDWGNEMLPRNGLSGTDGQMMMRQTAEQQTMVPNSSTLEQQMIIPNPAGISLQQKQKNGQLQQKLCEKRRKRKNSSKSLSKDKVSDGTNGGVKKSSNHNIKSLSSPDDGNASLSEQNGFFFREVGSLDSSKGKVLCCHFSPEGKLLASAGDDKKVLLWDMTTYDSVASAVGHSDIITDVRFKPSSHVFATSSLDRTVQIWDSNKPSRPLCKLLGHSGQVTSLDFHSKKGNLLCSCDSNDEIKLWNIDHFSCGHTFKGATTQVRFQPRSATLLAAASGNRINLFDVETSTLQYCLEGHAKAVKSICWDTSGKYMASVSEEDARVWSIVHGGKCIRELQSNGNKFKSCSFHPGYSNVLIIGSNQSLQVWNSIQSNQTLTLPAHNGIVSALASCTQTEMIASASHDQCIKLWK